MGYQLSSNVHNQGLPLENLLGTPCLLPCASPQDVFGGLTWSILSFPSCIPIEGFSGIDVRHHGSSHAHPLGGSLGD